MERQPPPAPIPPADPAGRAVAWLVVVLLVVAAYAHTLDAPFVYDDKVEVVGNRTIRFLDQWRAILAYNVARPLLIATYALNLHIGGFEPRVFHLTNLAVHGLAVGAALWLAEGVGRLLARPRALLVGAVAVGLWALHPMATESVIYTTGRSESLCGLFVFASIGSQVHAILAGREGRRQWGWRLGALAFFAAAATTKEVAAMLPLALLWTEWTLGNRSGGLVSRLKRLPWAWFLPFFVALGLAIALRTWHQGALLPREVDRPLAVQLTTSARVWLSYLWLWLVPVGQTIFHDQADLRPGSPAGLLGLGGFAALVAGAVAWARGRPGVAWALGCAALFLVPSSSFVPLKENMAEHRAYQQGLYLFLALAWTLQGRLGRLTPWVPLVLALLLLPATWLRGTVWNSEVSLWAEATRQSPHSAEAWYGLGDARRFSRQFKDAAEAYQQAVDLDPAYLDAWSNLGIALAEVGDAEGAEAAWRRALRVKPSFCRAHNNLGSLAFRRQQWEVARVELSTTLSYCPEDVRAHYMLGRLYDPDEGPLPDRARAERHYEAVVALDPSFDHIERVRARLLAITF